MKLLQRLSIAVTLCVVCILPTAIFAQSCDSSCANTIECQRKIEKCQEAWDQMEAAKQPHVDALRKMEADIAAFQNRIKLIESELIKKAAAIIEGEKELADLLVVASRRIRQFYMRSSGVSPLFALLSSTNVGSALRNYGYQQAVTNEDKKVITQTALLVKELEDKKKALEGERITLASMKEDVDKRAASIRKLVGDATAYQTKLTSYIASLTTKQQEFLGAKLSSLNLPTSLGAGPLYCTDDRKLDPGFSPAFAFFTFGIPHRVGMNQYGALGRAQAGQGYQDILRAYFDGINFEKKDNITIRVSGYGSMSLEQYMLGIYEIPGDWPMEALKAQAVAARSYALAYTQNGANEICTTQSCQVYKGGNKGGNWEQAVKATEREVMTKDGQVITAWFSSTDGGYTYTSSDVGWSSRSWTKRTRDTTGDIGSFSDLFTKAYDRDSPCFYAAQGFRTEYAKSAWLKSEEVADIANVILLARNDSSLRNHLYQPDKTNPEGVETWGKDRVKQELQSRGITPFTSVSGVSATGVDFGVGRTTQVTVNGDRSAVGFDGDEFRNYFNIRAPANIQIVGPLFNIERK